MISQTRQVISRFSTFNHHYAQYRIKPRAVSDANISRSGRRYPKPLEKHKSVHEQRDREGPTPTTIFDQTEYPDVTKLGNMYPAYDQEQFDRKRRSSRWRMTRKHFKECFKPEVSLLTYAEKEQMRYLHRTDPNEWSEEYLALAFPISVDGVRTLLRSPFRCLTVADIQQHDEKVAERLEKIRIGEIELSPELEEKMKIRKSIPIKLGAISTPELGLLVVEKPKKLGAFARLVSADTTSTLHPDPVASPIFKNKVKPILERKLKEGSSSNPKDPVDVHEVQTLSPSHEESKMLSGMPRGHMTIKEFENEIRRAHKSGKISDDFPEDEKKKLAYLLKTSIQSNPVHSNTLPVSSSGEYVPTPKDFIETSHMQKFAKSPTEDNVEVNVETGEAYISSPGGVQKPFAQRQQHIRLPRDALKEGSIYKVGDSYYDGNGNFLYRPV